MGGEGGYSSKVIGVVWLSGYQDLRTSLAGILTATVDRCGMSLKCTLHESLNCTEPYDWVTDILYIILTSVLLCMIK